MNNAAKATRIPQEISIRILSGNPNHHLPPSPADIRRATARRDGDPQEQEAAQKRYAVAMMRWFAEAKRKHSLRSRGPE